MKPSFLVVEESEDMDAILARTHLIAIADTGIYHRVGSAANDPVKFISWDEKPKDLMASCQPDIFKKYKMNPHLQEYPPCYWQDFAWSQELAGETIPRSCTILRSTNLSLVNAPKGPSL